MFKQRVVPGPGQESVWDYPRPPRLEKVPQRLRVLYKEHTIADTTAGYRVLETSHPPTYYFPPGDVNKDYITDSPRSTFCEWKGPAKYHNIVVEGTTLANQAWHYPFPTKYPQISGYLSFYAGPFQCYVGEEAVQKQEGDYYGGWVTSNIVGPFKGGPGTFGW